MYIQKENLKQYKIIFAVFHSLNYIRLFVTPWTVIHQASLLFTISQSLLKVMSIESVMPSNHLILYCPLLLLSSIFPSTKVFSNELALHIRWPMHCSFSFRICPSSEYSGLNSFRIDQWDAGTPHSLVGLVPIFIEEKTEMLIKELINLFDEQTLTGPLLCAWLCAVLWGFIDRRLSR